MKNQITSKILKFAFAFMFILVASSCSEDNETLDAAALAKDQINSEIAAKGVKAANSFVAYVAIPAPAGCDDCVTESPKQVSSQTVVWGGGSKSKDITVTAWNDSDKFYIKVNSSNSVNIDGVKISYPYSVNGGGNTIYNNEYTGLTGVEVTYEYDLHEGWEACEAQNYAVIVDGAGGQALFGQTTYNLFEICPPLCIESFGYDPNIDGSYTFTYIPAEDMENAELIFTFAQGTTISGFTDWEVNGQTRKMIMSLDACEIYTWEVRFSAKCSGKSSESNVFTDFKVNNVSRKGTVNKIEIPCTPE